ncbi:UPF0496 protein 1-like [Magnolia sinica]|uniref:UPF0496 protein 1-like n=1 Tax=Magnolia sinica TaxID=86752 RepID=UPI00265852EF|nr:UPF0496 protein 1-like [Magnolia sinica]
MGGQFSKKTGESLPAIQTPGNFLSTADLSSYESACRLDPDLQTFDTALHARTNRVINSLAVGVELRSLSFNSLREVTGSFVEMNQEVAKILLECKKDIWKNQELSNLVEEYFDKSLQMFDFCAALENCLSRARDSQLIIQLALQHFEAEGNGSTDDGKKYSRTLEELKNFKAAGDPFTEEFFQIFESIYKQQISMLEKLQLHKSNINEKLKSVKTWRKVSSIIFASAIVAVFICTVVAAAVAAPPVLTALAGAASVPLGSMGAWFNSLWTNYEVALKEQKEMVSSMWAGTFISIKDMDSIRALVDQLEIEIESLLRNADFALRDEEAVRVGIGEIKKKLGVFTTSLKDLGDHINSCIRDIKMARTVVLQKMINPPN